ncbi:MAG: hypothetical protein GY737_08250, partial [Desulfobacteraceae bacterium]|nr:hypothetical protein [Desulfobacteraceae bacterium]
MGKARIELLYTLQLCSIPHTRLSTSPRSLLILEIFNISSLCFQEKKKMFPCLFCPKKYTSAFNLRRHMALGHKAAPENAANTDDGKRAVLQIVSKVILEMDEIETEADMSRDENYEALLMRVKQKVVNALNRADLLKQSHFIKEIETSAEKFAKEGLTPFECREMAWSERRYLLKKLLKENADEITALFESSEEEDEEGDDTDTEEEEQSMSDAEESMSDTEQESEDEEQSMSNAEESM